MRIGMVLSLTAGLVAKNVPYAYSNWSILDAGHFISSLQQSKSKDKLTFVIIASTYSNAYLQSISQLARYIIHYGNVRAMVLDDLVQQAQ